MRGCLTSSLPRRPTRSYLELAINGKGVQANYRNGEDGPPLLGPLDAERAWTVPWHTLSRNTT
jgi:hypothetical protein